MALKVLALGTAEESRKAYDDSKCDVLTSDVSQLAERLKLAAPDSHIILPEVISKEPLRPAVRQGDDQWFSLVVGALCIDQCRGAGRQIGDDRRCGQICQPQYKAPGRHRGEFGEQLGWERLGRARRHAVGNYGESMKKRWNPVRLSIPRGLNALWTQGGIQYAPPIR
jgi:general L-amino acid transport system substrate-binding protein